MGECFWGGGLLARFVFVIEGGGGGGFVYSR